MSFRLSARSLSRLEGVHPELVAVVKRAIELTPIDFSVTEGRRDLETQKRYVAEGKSKTMNSRHLTGHAVDLVALRDGKASWDLPDYATINEAMQAAAAEQHIPVTWGGSWKSFVDGPHWELDRGRYPA